MRTGVFLLGGVEMPDDGVHAISASARRFDQQAFWYAEERVLGVGVLCEELGFDTFWLTEHHFQHEGYEVIPNGILFGAFLAARTQRIMIGALFHIVPQWHPLRLAEDFAILHNLSGGRAILGVGRGTVPREALPLGTTVAGGARIDESGRVDPDQTNREMMDEAMAVIELALNNETFSFHGKHYDFPPPGIAAEDGDVTELTLVPRPKYPYEIWQAITSPPTLEQVPRKGYNGVFWLKHYDFLKQFWDRYAEIVEETTGTPLASGEKRMLVLNVRVANTHEEAIRTARRSHDEFWNFLAPFGWARGYRGPDGKPLPTGAVPSFEESLKQKIWIVGTAEEVAEGIDFFRTLLGLQHLTIVPGFPGDSYDEVEEQLARFSQDVFPLLGIARQPQEARV
jgi:alkanesulfonate monooxygenase SsuD/methylene tetrahydromethanopterin reductase-like flavin-dependent oxidoreductase (luciferase family)